MSAVRSERRGRVTTVTLDRPPLNILDLTTLRDLTEAVDGVRRADGCAVLVLRAEGKAFCAGVDVADHAPDRIGPSLAAFHAVFRSLEAWGGATIARVQGPALGGGAELACACDWVLASDRATFGFPEIRLGVFPPVAAALLPGLVGERRATDLVLSGRVIPAAEAERIGLASRVVPEADLDGAVSDLAAGLSAMSLSSLRLARRALRPAGRPCSFGQALDRAERIYLEDLMRTADAREGIAAFLQKRDPVWRDA